MNKFITSFVIIYTLVGAAFSASPLSLESGFQSPPQTARPLVWWDLANGSVTKEGIRADMLDMKRAGIAGVQLFDLLLYMPPGPVRYGSDSWLEHVRYAIDTAAELGLEFYTMNAPGWSASGGPWVTPERSMKKLVWSETPAAGGPFKGKLAMSKDVKLKFYRDVAVFAVPASSKNYRIEEWKKKTGLASTSLKRPVTGFAQADAKAIPPENVLNLTKYLSGDGSLACTLPAGKWTVLRFGYTSTANCNHPAVPEGTGLEIDKLDPASVEFQFNQALSKIIERAGPHLGKTFKGILFDSFEGGFQNWTERMPTLFEDQNGYELIPWLPLFTGRVIGSMAESEAVLYDFRGTIDRNIADNYFGTMQRLSRQHGLIVYSESQGGPLNPFYCNEYVDVPMNEFWVGNYDKRIHLMKQAAASANLYGKSVVGAESFTAVPDDGKWQNTPYSLKIPGDCAFTSGINRFIFHTYLHQPYSHVAPGFTMGRYGTHFGRLNSWWKFVPGWIDYLARSQFLLQQGRTVNDFCLLQHNDIRYTIPTGDATPPSGFDATFCYPKHLAEMTCREGITSTKSGLVQFRVMSLPPRTSLMRVDTLRDLLRLVKEGMVLVGDPPVSPPGLADLLKGQKEFEALSRELWGGLTKSNPSKNLGKGQVFLKTPLAKVAAQLNLAPDLVFSPVQEQADLRYIHRAIESEDIYFIANQTDHPISISAAMRISGRQPELWDPATGKTWDASVFKVNGSLTKVPLNLDPRGSIFVVFRRPLAERWVTSVNPVAPKTFENHYLLDAAQTLTLNYSDGKSRSIALGQPSSSRKISEPWKVKFLDGRGAPEQITLEKLISWTDHADPEVNHYSGIAEYTATVNLPENFLKRDEVCLLDLGRVRDIAQIRVNGSQSVILWKEPFKTEVTGLLKARENTITIQVANRWINRLIGDQKTPVEFPYQEGGSKFTAGRILKFPDWLADPQLAKKQQKRHTFTTWQHYSSDSELVPSGLLGTVALTVFSKVEIK
jgi:hypothetical protein